MVAEDPSPKFQFHSVGVPVEVSVKADINGIWPLTGVAVKEPLTGAGAGAGVGDGVGVGVGVGVGAGAVTLMKFVMVLVALPPVFVTVRLTV